MVKSGAAGSESKDVWFFGTVNKYQLKSLKHIQTKNDSVLFPGMMAGWESEEEARANSVNWCTEESKQNYKTRYGEEWNDETGRSMVMLKVNAKTFRSVTCREVVIRLNAKFGEYKLNDDGVHEFTLTEEELMSFDDWKAKYPEEEHKTKKD